MRRSFSGFVKEIGLVRSHGPIPGLGLDWETEIQRMTSDNDNNIDMAEFDEVALNV
jgi:hypothetical protein